MNGFQEFPMSEDVPTAKVIISTDTKKCSKCGKKKRMDEFQGNKSKKSGVNTYCKSCMVIYSKSYYQNNPNGRMKCIEAVRRYQKSHCEKTNNDMAVYRQKNKHRIAKKAKEWHSQHPESRILSAQRRREFHLEDIRAAGRKNSKKRRSTPKGKLNVAMSNAIRGSLVRGKNGRSWLLLVDFTLDQLRNSLEKQFTEGMSWGNIGKWHIDHKIPLTAFNYETPDDIDFKKCWALSNLQPMWARENIQKSDKLEKPHQPSLAIGA